MSEAIKARFMAPAEGEPGHEYVNGVAARNLTESEYDALPPDERLLVHNAKMSNGKPLYQLRTETEMHPAKAASKDSDKKDDD